MKESERTLLFAMAEFRIGNCARDAFLAALKAAYADQQPAEPKPGIGDYVSDRVFDGSRPIPTERLDKLRAAACAEQKPSTLDQHQECYNQWRSGVEPKPSGSITLTPVAPSPEAIRDFERRAGRATSAKEAEPKLSVGVNLEPAVEAAQRAYHGAYTSKKAQWNAIVLAIKPYLTAAEDAEIAAVIRDNDAKMEEIEGLKAERLALRAKLADPRNPDIEAAAKILWTKFAIRLENARDIARAILTREPG